MNNYFRIIFSTIACSFIALSVRSQSTISVRARGIIDTLASAHMGGRGFVDSGEYKAASFVRNQFRRAGLFPFNENYYQNFPIDANTFPGKAAVTIDHKKLIPGKDFLIDPASSGIAGRFKTVKILKKSADSSESVVADLLKNISQKNLKNRVLAFRKENFTSSQYKYLKEKLMASNCLGARGCIEFSNDKLTWDASQKVLPFFYLEVNKSLVEKKKICIKTNIENKFLQNYPAQNVIAYIKGTSVPDSFIVLTAHYDHLGKMGSATYFPGANDNASGIAMLVCLANYFSNEPLKYSIAFMAFSGEESGLVGSHYYVEHPLFPLSTIKFLVNADIVGTGDEGIKVVNATIFKNQFDKLVALNTSHQYLKLVSPRGKAANSDHYFFTESGVPSFFIYTMGGISAYHDIYDRADTLPLTKFGQLYNLLIDFANSL